MEINRDIQQRTPKWDAARIFSIGGSSISKAVAAGKGKTRNQLLYDFVGEVLSGEKKPLGFSRKWIEDGNKFEADGLELYEFLNDVQLDRVGIVTHSEHKHFSPDSLCGDDGLIELKTVIPSTFVERVDTGNVPTDHRRQCQWGMFICERKWAKYILYCPAVKKKREPLHVIHIKRDEKEIRWLNDECNKFIVEMKSLLLKVMKGG